MAKQRLVYISLLLYFLMPPACLAQTFFGSEPNSTQTQPPENEPNKVMSPEEYKNMVNKLGEQNQENLNKSAKDYLNKQAPAIPSAMPAQPANPIPANTPGSQPALVAPPPASAVPTAAAPAYPPPAAAPVIRPTQPAPAVAPPAQNNAPQNQPYTGFGNFGNTNNSGTTNTNPSDGKSKGWNINY